MKAYEKVFGGNTPQTEPIPGETQVQNNAGGFVYSTGPWVAFERFLILGTEGGSYYVKEQKLTADAAVNTLACIRENGQKAVDLIVNVSDAGRAVRNTPAEFALALAASDADPRTRAYALAHLEKVCRIPTHLFHFITFVRQRRGWGRGLKRAVSAWYKRWDENKLAYELIKYQARDGWANVDLFSLAHIDGGNTALMRWLASRRAKSKLTDQQAAREVVNVKTGQCRSYPAVTGELPGIIHAFNRAQAVKDNPREVARLIREHKLTREMVPTEALTDPDVWQALLDANMPITALLRNLGNMSKVGLVKPLAAATKVVCDRLRDREGLKRGRVHPVSVLLALKTYGQGRGMLGKGEWTPVPAVVDALDDAFYAAFDAIEPTNKRYLIALDVSGSMGSPVSGLPISCAEGAAAMAMAIARAESNYHVMGFADSFRELGITPKMRLDQVLAKTTRMNFGSTDCSLPMLYAQKHKLDVDGFIVITDNETFAGRTHPSQALKSYRAAQGIASRQVVLGMTATNFTIADPKDPLTLDVAGFDASVPQAITEFMR